MAQEATNTTSSVKVPRSPPPYASQQEAINTAKCQLYQWMQVQGLPSPARHQMYLRTFQQQYPINFDAQSYDDLFQEVATIYRSKHQPAPNTDENNTGNNDQTDADANDVKADAQPQETKNNNDVNDPEWMHLQDGNIDNLLLDKYNIDKLSVSDRSLGCLLGVFMVDALGAPVEGWPYESIVEQLQAGGVVNMIPGTHMGARNKGPRCGYYTDDTMTTMALALSIVLNQKLLAQHAAENYYLFWKRNPVYRGLPDSAQKVLRDVHDGMSITKTGRQSFPDGSFANGGAMRISSVGIVYRNADAKVLRDAVTDAVMSSHCHPQSVDGAMAIALMVQYALKCDGVNKKFDAPEMAQIVLKHMETKDMKEKVQAVIDGYSELMSGYNENESKEEDSAILDVILEADIEWLKYWKLLTFQIKAIEAVPFVLYALLRWHQNPEQCAINVVTLGGDCDTTGNMVGAVLGCLYGTSWIPNRWFLNLENTWMEREQQGIDEEPAYYTDAFGLDLALYLGLELAKLDFKQHEKFKEAKNNSEKTGFLSKMKKLLPT